MEKENFKIEFKNLLAANWFKTEEQAKNNYELFKKYHKDFIEKKEKEENTKIKCEIFETETKEYQCLIGY